VTKEDLHTSDGHSPCVNADSYTLYVVVPQVAACPWSHFPIMGLSSAACLLIIEVRKGADTASCRETVMVSRDPQRPASSAVNHTKLLVIDSIYTAWGHDCFLTHCYFVFISLVLDSSSFRAHTHFITTKCLSSWEYMFRLLYSHHQVSKLTCYCPVHLQHRTLVC
jgi:hypothetical protein